MTLPATGIISFKDVQDNLSNVNNTSDINKPVSTLQAAADQLILTQSKNYTDSKLIGNGAVKYAEPVFAGGEYITSKSGDIVSVISNAL